MEIPWRLSGDTIQKVKDELNSFILNIKRISDLPEEYQPIGRSHKVLVLPLKTETEKGFPLCVKVGRGLYGDLNKYPNSGIFQTNYEEQNLFPYEDIISNEKVLSLGIQNLVVSQSGIYNRPISNKIARELQAPHFGLIRPDLTNRGNGKSENLVKFQMKRCPNLQIICMSNFLKK